MIHYSNILPPIQCDSLIKRSIATLYDVLCLIEESSILSIKEMGLLAEDITAMSSSSSTDSNFTTKSKTTDTKTTTETINSVLANAFLYQNTPNPFKENTEIRFQLSADAKNSLICIFDMQGKMLKQISIDPSQSSITIDGTEFNAGMYLYSLVINGNEIDTKRMILTK